MKDPTDVADVTLAVLAGGQGARMGMPKAELSIEGVPILQYLSTRFFWSGPKSLVTGPGREHPPGREYFSSEVVDPVAGEGPLRGILTALENCQTDKLLVTTVDMPDFSGERLRTIVRLFREEQVRNPEIVGMMMSRKEGCETTLEPFPLALRRSAIVAVQNRLVMSRRSVQGLSSELGFHVIPAPESWERAVWTNLNSPADAQAYRASIVEPPRDPL